MFCALFYNIKYSSKCLLVNTEDFTYTREAVLITGDVRSRVKDAQIVGGSNQDGWD